MTTRYRTDAAGRAGHPIGGPDVSTAWDICKAYRHDGGNSLSVEDRQVLIEAILKLDGDSYGDSIASLSDKHSAFLVTLCGHVIERHRAAAKPRNDARSVEVKATEASRLDARKAYRRGK